MYIRIIVGLEDCVGRDINFDSAIKMHSNIFKARNIEYACLLEVFGDINEDLS